MVKIVVTQDLGLTPSDIERLKQLGDLTIYDKLSKHLMNGWKDVKVPI